MWLRSAGTMELATKLGGHGCRLSHGLHAGNQLTGSLASQSFQQPLHDRLLRRPELAWTTLDQAPEDDDRGEPRLGREPHLDFGKMTHL